MSVTNWWVNIGSGNGLVPSGNKPLLDQCWPRSKLPYGVTMSWHASVYAYQVPFALVHLWYSHSVWFPGVHVSTTDTSHPWPGTVSLNIAKQGSCVHFPIFFSYSFYIFYLVLILWMWLEGNFTYDRSALLPWLVYTSLVNQLESHYSD